MELWYLTIVLTASIRIVVLPNNKTLSCILPRQKKRCAFNMQCYILGDYVLLHLSVLFDMALARGSSYSVKH
jgi:hypothetical protein